MQVEEQQTVEDEHEDERISYNEENNVQDDDKSDVPTNSLKESMFQ